MMKSNILVVDDEPVARQSLTDILKLEGYLVNSAPNGQAAVEYCKISRWAGVFNEGKDSLPGSRSTSASAAAASVSAGEERS